MEMVDPPLCGGSFTWRKGQDHICASRVDRFLYCAEWGENFTQIIQSSPPKIASDHNPIMLSCGDEGWRKSYFKFETWWLEVEGFKEKVKDWWESFSVTGRPVQEQRPHTDDELLQKTHLRMEFEDVARKGESSWKQRSRIQWLKQGDENTRFFYRIATSHKRFNYIDQLEVAIQLCSSRLFGFC
ncbi:hypothetical protein MTR67_018412 [Solanum verrucosum]|uniref:Uncharacterized protein n=1 Tax=Solanum verrucosum TaxID=315347 RepID=A0AAF0TLK2_SOLVR|nr:hypothetical protein MTR67_018412 [Solanum verrucosum]